MVIVLTEAPNEPLFETPIEDGTSAIIVAAFPDAKAEDLRQQNGVAGDSVSFVIKEHVSELMEVIEQLTNKICQSGTD